MSSYPNIQTIRYMGNKSKLLNFIIPYIKNETSEGDIVCDIMAGTNSIGYALKERNVIISNDIQYYSYIISKCLLGNYEIPDEKYIHFDLEKKYNYNITNRVYSFFYSNYQNTYFSPKQCLEIDSFRYAIQQVDDENKRCLYLTLLMSAMCKAQSTTGHFAQYLNSNNARVRALNKLSIYDLFYSKLSDFKNFVISKYKNYFYNVDYNDLFKNVDLMKSVKCFYLDSPYTSDHYSRFYHILETVCKYDNPILEYKGKYRNNRFKSNFCYSNKVASEFEKIISFCHKNNSKLIISYSNYGLIAIRDLFNISKKYYNNVDIDELPFQHSTQGKGNLKIYEKLILLK